MDRAQGPPASSTPPEARMVIEAAFAEHRQVLQAASEQLPAAVEAAAGCLVEAYRAGGKAILFGNGGSMSDALHIEGELVNRFSVERPGVAAVALCSPSAFTATANDYSYEDVFARMLVAHARPGDVAVGFSTSGNSENVVRALQTARERGLGTIALTGRDGGRCAQHADVAIRVPSTSTPRIQELHIVIGHTLCDLIERALFPRG